MCIKTNDFKPFRIRTYAKTGEGGVHGFIRFPMPPLALRRLPPPPFRFLLACPRRSTLPWFRQPVQSQGGLLWQQQSWNPPLKSAPTNFSSTTNGSTPLRANPSPPSTPPPAKSSLTSPKLTPPTSTKLSPPPAPLLKKARGRKCPLRSAACS